MTTNGNDGDYDNDDDDNRENVNCGKPYWLPAQRSRPNARRMWAYEGWMRIKGSALMALFRLE